MLFKKCVSVRNNDYTTKSVPTISFILGSTMLRFLKRSNEVYTWNNVDCRIHNILIGELYLEQCGEQTIECKRTGLQCRIRYLSSKIAEQMHTVEG